MLPRMKLFIFPILFAIYVISATSAVRIDFDTEYVEPQTYKKAMMGDDLTVDRSHEKRNSFGQPVHDHSWNFPGRNPFNEPEPYGLEDDEVQKYINSVRDPLCAFKVDCRGLGISTLDDKSIDRFIRNNDRAYILYHLDVSTKATNAYLQFAAARNEPGVNAAQLGAVACHDWTYACRDNGITTWPTMKVYEYSKLVTEYKGVWNTKAIATFIQNFNEGTPIVLNTIEEAEQFLKGEAIKHRSEKTQRVTLGLFERYDDPVTITYADVAQSLRGAAVMGLATGVVARTLISKYFPTRTMPVIVTVSAACKDAMEPMFFCPKKQTDLMEFVKTSQNSGVVQISATNFHRVYRRGLPIAIVIGEPKSFAKVCPAYYETAKMLKDKIAFTELCIMQQPEFSQKIMEEFNIKKENLPAVILSMPKDGNLCKFERKDLNGLTEQTLAESLENCLMGKENSQIMSKLPKYDWTNRKPMYDYTAVYYKTGPIISDPRPLPLKVEL